MSLYGRFFARFYDRLLASTEEAGLGERRRQLLASAQGRVLEIGAGTGANLDYYTDAVNELVLTEPEEPMALRLDRHLTKQRRPATIVEAPAEKLPFEDGSFDTVVCTLVLCTVSDPERSLAEIRRVLKPGGMLLFCEHVRSSEPRLARWQDRANRINRVIAHGCNCNRPTAELIERSGLQIQRLEQGELEKTPPIIRPLVVGAAVAPGG